MARLASTVKNEKRLRMGKNQLAKRKELKKIVADPNANDEEKFKAMKKLSEMPRNGSLTRHRSRCVLTGRPRAVFSDFGLCRNKFRELALKGMLPGVTKSSW